MPQATPRIEIIETYRQRIAHRKHQRLSSQELDDLITGFIETLTHLTHETAIQQHCQTEIKLLEEGYPQTTLATKYLAKYRKAIETAIALGTLKLTPANSHQYQHQQRITGIQTTRIEHFALTHLKYTPEIYETLDKRQSQTNRTKQLNLRPVPLERYLQTLQTLLTHQSPLEARTKAIAIAGLTGRRIGEVLARGTFTLTDHPHLLYFEGQQKSQPKNQKTKEHPGYNIITLIPAIDLLNQIQQFRQLPEIHQISTLEGEPLKSAINQLDVQINRQCDRHLGQTGIVPPLQGKKTVTVHNLRSLWGAIATHLFCPDHYHEYAFLQHYLGHVLDSAATGNYLRYQLTDPQGSLLREKGILLTQIGALPLIEEEHFLIEEEPEQDHPTPLLDLLSQDPASMTSKAKAQDPTPELTPSSEPDLRQLRTEWQQTLTQKITALRSELETQLETQLTQLRQTSNTDELISRIATLETENATLTQNLKQAQDKLDRFRQLLNGTDTPEIETQPDPDIEQTDQTQQPKQPKQPKQPNSNNEIAPDRPSQIKPRGSHPGKAFQRAEAIVLAIKDWNRLYPSESFAINAGILETVFRVHRQAVKAFFEAYQNELWEYHQDIGVESPRWHNRGKDTQKLKVFVTQGLEN